MSTTALSINFAYIISAALFIFGLKMLSSPATARRGNLLSAVGMLLAIVVTLFSQGLDYKWILLGMVIGSTIGLIVAELCINSLKHAFTDKSRGKISVILTKENEVKTLCFKDDGKGLGNNPDDTLAAGTGYNLVNIFVEELGGSIEYFSKQGTEIVITFI